MQRWHKRCRWASDTDRWEMAHKLQGGSIYKIKVKMRKKEMSGEMKEQREERRSTIGAWRRGPAPAWIPADVTVPWRTPAVCQRQNQLKAKGCHVSQDLGLQLNLTLGGEVLGVKKW